MKKRMLIMLLAMAALIAVLAVVKVQQIQAGIAQGRSFRPPPEAVTTIIARQERWPAAASAIGTIAAVQGVMVSADSPGIVERITFESGRPVKAGEVLVRLDARQEEAQLTAAEAALRLTGLNLDRMRGLREKGITSQAELDRLAAEHEEAQARVGEIRATIARKTIRAPFAGILGIRQVNLGQYLAGGDPVAPLQSIDPIHVDFTVPQQQLGQMTVGATVTVSAENVPGLGAKGRVTAVDSVVDEATRNIRVQATLPNPGGYLRPGMFVQTQILLGEERPVVALPASAISYAPYGDSVFVVTELQAPDGTAYRGVRQQVVKLGAARGDQVAITTGVAAGDEVVTSGTFKLRNGTPVQVNNTVQPANDPAPEPEDS